MNPVAAGPSGWRHQRLLWVLVGGLVLVGAGLLLLGGVSSRRSLAGPTLSRPAPTIGATRPAHRPTPVATPPTTPPVARSTPVELRIPAISLAVSLSTLGLNPDGTVEVPTDIQQPGWFRLGPSPGQIGSAVILGHVDSYQGPAVFFELRSLVAGDRVIVDLADGVTTTFKVTSVAMYQKTAFPDRQVYGSHGSSALQLVTCGGVFDGQTGHYLSNTVVYSSLVSVS